MHRLVFFVEAARVEPRNIEELQVARVEKEMGETERTSAVTSRDETETALVQLRRDYGHLV